MEARRLMPVVMVPCCAEFDEQHLWANRANFACACSPDDTCMCPECRCQAVLIAFLADRLKEGWAGDAPSQQEEWTLNAVANVLNYFITDRNGLDLSPGRLYERGEDGERFRVPESWVPRHLAMIWQDHPEYREGWRI